MAKVEFPGGFLNPAVYTGVKAETGKAKQKTAVKKPLFSRILETAGETALEETETLGEFPASEEALQKLLDEVHSSGDALKQRPFPDEIKYYKRAVRDFIHYVVENGYTVERQDGTIPKFLKPGFTGSRKSPEAKECNKYTLVQVIDRKLEQLAAGIMAGQLTQLNLLARVDEITGLLVNLLQ
jgi:uncharacterized protein YaaR (DUF327 family)